MNSNKWVDYYMNMLDSVKLRSSCCRRQVSAIITTPNHEIITTGYNGTPSGTLNCEDGGCDRCNSDTPSGQGYDRCLCIHAEKNAIYSAAKQGKSVTGSILYVSDRPCNQCVMAITQVGIRTVFHKTDSVKVNRPSDYTDYSIMINNAMIDFFEYQDGEFCFSEFFYGPWTEYVIIDGIQRPVMKEGDING